VLVAMGTFRRKLAAPRVHKEVVSIHIPSQKPCDCRLRRNFRFLSAVVNLIFVKIDVFQPKDMSSESLRVLLLGNGGREHALAWKLSHSSRVEAIYVFPGNGGTESLPKTRNVAWIDAHNYRGLVQFALLEGINLAAPSTEKPLIDGIKELFESGEKKFHILFSDAK
jgi:hypothetical protein